MKKTACGSVFFLLFVMISFNVLAQSDVNYLVNWDPNPEPDITGYVVFRSLDRNSGFEPIDSVGNNTFTYLDTGLEKGVRYYYRLLAKNSSGGRSGLSNPVSGMTIPDDAPESLQDSCKITLTSPVGTGSYRINWETLVSTTGFIQYDMDETLDSMSYWDETQFGQNHSVQIDDLENGRYYARAVAFDNLNNLTISSQDTLLVQYEDSDPVSLPQLSIYPVPFHPVQGNLNMLNLPVNGSVRIYNSGGVEVFSEDVGADGEITWDGSNQNGNTVASGVYYVLVNDSKGKTVSRKPIIIVN